MPLPREASLNVPDPRRLADALNQVITGFRDFLEAARESEWPRVTESGCVTYDLETGKCGFQVANQFERPAEFMQCLMDMLRVHYEPELFGTFFLNANIGFALQLLPESPFRLGYASQVSQYGKAFPDFWKNDILPSLEQFGYAIESASGLFVVVSSPRERLDMDAVGTIMEATGAGFKIEDVISEMAAAVAQSSESSSLPTIHAGFVADDALESRWRVSVWLLLDRHTSVQ